MNDKTFGIVVVGAGTVGGAVAQQIVKEAPLVREKTGINLELRHIVEKNLTQLDRLGLDRALACDLDTALADPAVDCVVELVGGTGFARTAIESALTAGKQVVTANKALLSLAGAELFALARNNQSCIAFEASCEGAVPIVRALCDGLIANRVQALYGIVNGTCNYILSAMTKEGRSYAEVLAEAQKDGLAEADPTLDVSGMDSAHKLAILSSLAFGRAVSDASFPVSGIDTLDSQDILYGKELGYTVKLLAVAIGGPEGGAKGLHLSVQPWFIALDHPLAQVSGAFNAVSVYGHSSGHSMYYGRGAGGLPTSSAVMADIVSCASGVSKLLFNQLRVYPDLTPKAQLLDSDTLESRHYLRLQVSDKPGVLASVANILSKHGISISGALQKEVDPDSSRAHAVPFVITTHRCSRGAMRQATSEIAALEDCSSSISVIPILDEHEEFQKG